MTETLKTVSGNASVLSQTLLTTATSSELPPEPTRLDPFFSVPSIVVTEPQMHRRTEDDVVVSITF